MADQDPFAEFGGQEIADEPEAKGDEFAAFGVQAHQAEPDPFAAFGGQEITDEQAPEPAPVAPQQGERTQPTKGDYAQNFLEGATEGGFLNMRSPLDYAKAAGDYITAAVDPHREANFDESLAMARANSEAQAKLAPKTRVAGQIAGAIGTAFVPGSPTANLAKGATALGSKVGGSVAGALASGAAQGVARQGLFARVAGVAAKGAIEGGIATGALGAAAVLDKAVETGDTESLAQKMAAGAIHEFKSGAVFGAGLGIVGMGVKKVADALPSVSDFASGRAFKALGGGKKKIALAELRVQGGTRAVGRTMLDEGIVTAADPTLEGTLQRAEAAQENLGRALGDVRDQIGDIAGDVVPSRRVLIQKIQEEVIDPLLKSPATRRDGEKVADRLRPFWDDAIGTAEKPVLDDTLPFELATEWRKGVDSQLANFDSVSQKTETEAYRKVRRVMNNYWMDTAEQAAEKAGQPELIAKVRDLTQRYARVAVGNDLLQETLKRKAANRSVSLTDYITGSGLGASAGAAVGTALGVGPAAGAVVGGAAAAGVNKLARERGNFFMSGVLDKAAKRTLAVQTKLQNISALKGLTAPRAITTLSEAAHIKAGPLPVHAIDNAVKQADELQDPESPTSENLGASLQHMEPETGPELAQALHEHAMAQAQFLLQKAGPMPPPSPFGGTQPQRQWDEETQAQLGRYVQALQDPMDALARISDGEGTVEDREVLQQPFNSRIWQEFQERAVHAMAERGKELPYDKQLAVADALGLPLVPGADGTYMSFWQGVATAGQQQAAEKAAAKAKLQGGKGVMSKADRAMG